MDRMKKALVAYDKPIRFTFQEEFLGLTFIKNDSCFRINTIPYIQHSCIRMLYIYIYIAQLNIYSCRGLNLMSIVTH